jgi:hypothetical protein
MLDAHTMMRAIQPDLDVAEYLVNDRHIHVSVLARTLHNRKMLIFVQSGIALEPIADDQRAGLDVGTDEAANLLSRGVGENGDPCATSDEALLVDALLTFSTAATIMALPGSVATSPSRP